MQLSLRNSIFQKNALESVFNKTKEALSSAGKYRLNIEFTLCL